MGYLGIAFIFGSVVMLFVAYHYQDNRFKVTAFGALLIGLMFAAFGNLQKPNDMRAIAQEMAIDAFELNHQQGEISDVTGPFDEYNCRYDPFMTSDLDKQTCDSLISVTVANDDTKCVYRIVFLEGKRSAVTVENPNDC